MNKKREMKTKSANKIIIKEIDGTTIAKVRRVVRNVKASGVIGATGVVRAFGCDWPVKTDDIFSRIWETCV